MDYKKFIYDIKEDKNVVEYFFVPGRDGYVDYRAQEKYFMEDYRQEYTKKLTLIVMLLTTWYETRVLFEAEDKGLSRTYSLYNGKVFKLETEKQVMDIKNIIVQCMTDKQARINFVFEDKKQNERFVFTILYDLYIGIHGMSDKATEYLKKLADKQGLTIWKFEDH